MDSIKSFTLLLYCCPAQGCTKEYRTKFNLKKHFEFCHLHMRRFKCEICTRDFVSKQNLNEHMFIHTGAKPYKCDQCGQNFRHSSYLSFHKRTHQQTYSLSLNYIPEGEF